MVRISKALGLLLLAFAALTADASAQVTVLHNFAGPDGASPTGLIRAGNFFYGAAGNGGDVTSCPSDGCGLVFRTDMAGHFKTLHVFHASDGYLPTGVIKGRDGNFYGTTMAGGQPSGGGGGTIFQIDSTGKFRVLYAFTGGFACCDGAGPTGPPIQASDGNLYGTTGGGGAFRNIHHQGGFGTVYRLNPTTGALTILHSFNFDGDSFYPNSPLIVGSDGFFYGTTSEGSGAFRDGPGVAFRIDTAGNFAVVSVLAGQPLSGLILAKDGQYYGTSQARGGYVLRVDASGNLTFVNLFDGADGWSPRFRLLQTSDGLFYGSAPQGGLLDFQGGDIFRLDAAGAIRVLHSFTKTSPEGFVPNSQLVQGPDGALYGTNGIGGSNGQGTIFRIDQNAIGPVSAITVKPAVVPVGLTSTGTVTLVSPAPAGGTVVTLGAVQGQIVIPPKVTVRAGATKASFKIKTLTIGATTTVRIYASVAGQGVRTTITVTP